MTLLNLLIQLIQVSTHHFQLGPISLPTHIECNFDDLINNFVFIQSTDPHPLTIIYPDLEQVRLKLRVVL